MLNNFHLSSCILSTVHKASLLNSLELTMRVSRLFVHSVKLKLNTSNIDRSSLPSINSHNLRPKVCELTVCKRTSSSAKQAVKSVNFMLSRRLFGAK